MISISTFVTLRKYLLRGSQERGPISRGQGKRAKRLMASSPPSQNMAPLDQNLIRASGKDLYLFDGRRFANARVWPALFTASPFAERPGQAVSSPNQC
jgi:hypothetical protein